MMRKFAGRATMDPTGYCFPEISENAAGCRAQSGRTEPDFRRAVPGKAPRPGPSAPAAAGRGGLGRGCEDIAQDAYCRGLADGERGGFEKGRQAAEEAGREQLGEALRGLRRAASELEDLRRSICEEVEEQTVQLALAVARKVAGRELSTDPQALAGIVREAFGRVEGGGRITIRLNPADLERLSGIQPAILPRFTESGLTAFVADEAISPGGCLVETEAGAIDARLEQQFRVVEEAFRAEIAGGAGLR
jgi:flagellar assembly protein FliH